MHEKVTKRNPLFPPWMGVRGLKCRRHFFIGNISRGRTVQQTILGGYAFGVGSTIVSFIVLGNYSLDRQTSGAADFIGMYTADGDLYQLILNIIDTTPTSTVVLILTLLCMIAFYATSFDSIAYTAACYSYKTLEENEKPHTMITLLWCLLLIALPIALVFSESSICGRSRQSTSRKNSKIRRTCKNPIMTKKKKFRSSWI